MEKEIIVEEIKETKKAKKVTKTKKEEEVVIVEEPKEEIKESVKEEPKGTIETLLETKGNIEVLVEDEKPAVKPQPMVRILLNQDHKCNIGGNWYVFKKDKHYNVPSNVKDILMRAGKLSPL